MPGKEDENITASEVKRNRNISSLRVFTARGIQNGAAINFSLCHVETVKTLTALPSLVDCACSPEGAGSNTSVLISKCAPIEEKLIVIY